MAKLSSINKNNKRIKLSNKYYKKRQKLKKIIMDKKLPLEERFKAQQKLSKMPRNSAKNRVMNRCQITGRPHVNCNTSKKDAKNNWRNIIII